MQNLNFHGEELTCSFDTYLNGQRSLRLIDKDGIPYMTASIGILGNHALELDGFFKIEKKYFDKASNLKVPYNQTISIKNYSENEGIEEALLDAGIIKKENHMGYYHNSHVMVNIYKIDF